MDLTSLVEVSSAKRLPSTRANCHVIARSTFKCLDGSSAVPTRMDGMIVKKCVLRGRPQEGRAVFRVFDFDGGDGNVNVDSLSEISKF